jgi:hypothetical protein
LVVAVVDTVTTTLLLSETVVMADPVVELRGRDILATQAHPQQKLDSETQVGTPPPPPTVAAAEEVPGNQATPMAKVMVGMACSLQSQEQQPITPAAVALEGWLRCRVQ